MRNINLYCMRACNNQHKLFKKISNYKYFKEIDAFYITDIVYKKNLSSLVSKEIKYYDKKICDYEFYKFIKRKNNINNIFLITDEKLLQQILRQDLIEKNYIYKCEILFTDLCDN